MPRNNLTDDQKAFIRENAHLGGNELSIMLSVDRGQIYQYATNEKFSVKKGGKVQLSHEKAISRMVRGYSSWPKKYYRYKKYLVERDGLRCHYCDVMMEYNQAQVDHILAKARGGSDAPSNLVLACYRCNHVKSTLCYSCPEFRNAIS
jgi:hypothetical protein